MCQEDLAIGQAEVLDVAQQIVLLDVRDSVFLSVVLPEHEARDGPVVREVNEPLVECGVFVKVGEVALQACRRDLRLECGERCRIDGEPGCLAAGKT